jgi:hypothetical protein
MLISDILSWSNEPTERNRSDLQPDLSPAPFSDDATNLANAFTRSGLVKHFANLNGSEGQPSEPAPPGAETELIPSGALEPTTASMYAEPLSRRSLRWVYIGSFRFGNSAAGQPPTRHTRDSTATAETL